MSNPFKFLNNIPDMSRVPETYKTKEEQEQSKLHKDLENWCGSYYHQKILRQVDSYLRENRDHEPPYKKADRIFLAYGKLAENKLNFFEAFYVVEMLLPNLNHMYKQIESRIISVDYFINNFLDEEMNGIIQIKKREQEKSYK